MLVCMKKAAKYTDWCVTNKFPHVLLTDWREVKPSIQALDQIGSIGHTNHQPAGIYVLADLEQLFQRASAWANTAGRDVTVISELPSAHQFLATCMSKIHSQTAQAALKSEVVDEEPDQQYYQEYEEEPDAPVAPAVAPVTPQAAPRSRKIMNKPIAVRAVKVEPSHDEPEAAPASTSSFSSMLSSSSSTSPAPWMILGTKLRNNPVFAAQVAMMLNQAMPNVYED